MTKTIDKYLKAPFRSLCLAWALLAPKLCFGVGPGSLNWKDDSDKYDTGPSGLGFGDALIPISIFVACWWFALSEKSPIKDNFWLKMFFMFLAPAIFVSIAAKVMR